MRKSIRVILFAALGLVVTGMLFTGLAVATGGTEMLFNFKENSVSDYVSATFDEVDFVDIDNVSGNVEIVKSVTDQVKVTYAQSEDFEYKVICENKMLSVKFEDFRKWYNNIFFFGYGDTGLVVELPEKTLKELNIKTTSGNIDAKDLNAAATNLKTTSGYIEVGGNVGTLNAHATSGRVEVLGSAKAEEMNIGCTSGRVSVSGDVKGDVIAQNTSGGMNIENLTCRNLDAKCSSGKLSGKNIKAESVKGDVVSGGINLEDAICTGDMNLESTSGRIVLKSVDAKNYDLSSTSGGIKAEILSPKIYDTDATSGSEKTPAFDADATGVLKAKTTSGSIKIELAD